MIPKPLKKLNPTATEWENWRREVNAYLTSVQADGIHQDSPAVSEEEIASSPIPPPFPTPKKALKAKPRKVTKKEIE